MYMPRDALMAWEGREYDHNPKDSDWYWSMGIIATAGTVAMILFGNYIVAVLIVVAAVALGLHAAKEPPLHQFQLFENGLMIGTELHPFDRMISFSVLEDIGGEYPPMLSIKTDSLLTPHLIIPLEGVDADTVYAYFIDRVKEEPHHHTLADVVAAWFGF
jgi:hypothetical protein